MNQSLFRLWTNARYEMKILMRGWFLRIFGIIGISLLLLMNFIFFTQLSRSVYGLSTFFPYLNILFFNILQSFLLILLATDICKRNRKLNTNDVLYVHSMTNVEYLLGQVLAVFIIFICLQLFFLTIGFIFNVLNNDVNFAWQPYIYYPILISIPTFFYILGLSFLSMHLIKNQAIVIVLLFGYLAVDLVFIQDNIYFFFDLAAFKLPLIYSDFTGLTHLKNMLFQRAIYLCLGIALLFIADLSFHRLRQSKSVYLILKYMSLVLIITSIYSGYTYLSYYHNKYSDRKQFINTNELYSKESFPTIKACHLDVTHKANQLEVKSNLIFVNQNNHNLEKFILTLNPDLKVKKILQNGKTIPFKRIDHIIEINPENKLRVNEIDSLTIYYAGAINENICYLDIPDKTYKQVFSIVFYRIDKKYCFLTSEYALLTSECLWYPSTILPRIQGDISKRPPDFIKFTLDVKTNKHLQVISQGKMTDQTEGKFSFRPDCNLPQLTLIIGSYEHHQISRDNCTYNLYHHPKHDYYKKYFTLVSDTLSFLIKELKEEFDQVISLKYPYSQFSIVETPIQYLSYKQLGSKNTARTPPEMSLFHENNIFAWQGNFNSMKRELENPYKQDNLLLTEFEKQAKLFKSYIRDTFLSTYFSNSSIRETGGGDHRCSVFPQYLSNSTYMYSHELYFFNSIIESYFNTKINPNFTAYTPFSNGMWLTDGERICLELANNDIQRIRNDASKVELLSGIYELKNHFLIRQLQSEINPDEFDQILYEMINHNRHRIIDARKYFKKINYCTASFIADWNLDTKLPAFEYSNIKLYKIFDGNRTCFQILLNIANVSEINGVCEIYFRTDEGNFNYSRSSSKQPDRIIKIEGRTEKEVGVVLNSRPYAITINPIMARNLPLVFGKSLNPIKVKDSFIHFDGERVIEFRNHHQVKNEIIVDDEGKNFDITNLSSQRWSNRLLHTNDTDDNNFRKYRWRRPPGRWSSIKHGNFYGTIIKSARYIKAGEGKNFVTWLAEIKETGYYTVYTYLPDKRLFRLRSSFLIKDLNYEIYHNDGAERVKIDFDKSEEGWNVLGTYYFSEGKVKVVLTDKTKGKLVLADAIRWVKN